MSVVSMPRGTKTPLGAMYSTPLPSPTVSNEVENIFVQNSLCDVKKSEEKLRLDIERKKDHLRGIVGERYRDLIDSADLIAELSRTSKQILSEVSVLKGRLGDVSKSLSSEASNRYDADNQAVSSNTYIQLLLILPEKIYNCVDGQQPVEAALLYLLASDICAHLQLSSDSSSTVVTTQARTRLSRCRSFLLTSCRHQLGALTMKTKATSSEISRAIGWLSALISVDFLTPMSIFEDFLACRMTRLESLVKDQASPEAVPEAILSYLSTAILSNTLFVDSHGAAICEVEEKITKLCPSSLTNEKDTIGFTLPRNLIGQLNKIVQNLVQSCHLENTAENLDPATVYNRLSVWLKTAGTFLATHIPILLEKAPSIKSLQTISENINKILAICCCQSHVPSTSDVWRDFLSEAVVQCFEKLLRNHFDEARTSLRNLFVQHEDDALPVIWSLPKGPSGLPTKQQQKLELGHVNRIQSDMFVVGHFAASYNATNLQAVIASLDSLLVLSKEFIVNGLPNDAREVNLLRIKQETSNFGQSVVEMCRNFLEQQKNDQSSVEKYVNTAAFSFSMTFLLSYVEDWLSNSNVSVTGKTISSTKLPMVDSALWSNCRNQIGAVSVEAFQLALKKFMSREITETFKPTLEAMINCDKNSLEEMAWLSVEIEEEGDDGQKILSKIAIPQQPSLNVYCFINSLCRLTLQSPAFLFKSNNSNSVIFRALIDSYSEFIETLKCSEASGELTDESPKSPVSQDCAIQYLFDFQLLATLLIGDYRRNQQFSSLCIDIVHALESHVDPFDLNTFQPHLAESVRKYAKTVQSMFGVILNVDNVAYRGGKAATPSSQAIDDHNVLRLSHHQGRLTSLSIPFSQAQLYPV